MKMLQARTPTQQVNSLFANAKSATKPATSSRLLQIKALPDNNNDEKVVQIAGEMRRPCVVGWKRANKFVWSDMGKVSRAFDIRFGALYRIYLRDFAARCFVNSSGLLLQGEGTDLNQTLQELKSVFGKQALTLKSDPVKCEQIALHSMLDITPIIATITKSALSARWQNSALLKKASDCALQGRQMQHAMQAALLSLKTINFDNQASLLLAVALQRCEQKLQVIEQEFEALQVDAKAISTALCESPEYLNQTQRHREQVLALINHVHQTHRNIDPEVFINGIEPREYPDLSMSLCASIVQLEFDT